MTRRTLSDDFLDISDAIAATGDLDAYARFVRLAYPVKPFLAPRDAASQSRCAPNEVEVIRRKARALIERGVINTPIIAALAFAEAQLGNREGAAALIDYDRFFSLAPLGVDAAFLAELAAEVRTKLRFVGDAKPGERSIHRAWRHEDVLNETTPAIATLRRQIIAGVDRYIGALAAGDEHPLVASRPEKYVINSWAVISQDEGHLLPHIHPRAWISGVFYVVCPDVAVGASDHRGSFRSAPPGNLVPNSGWAERFVEPTAGTLLLMPGYFFHSTEPTNASQERMVIAFDICPATEIDREVLEREMRELERALPASRDLVARCTSQMAARFDLLKTLTPEKRFA